MSFQQAFGRSGRLADLRDRLAASAFRVALKRRLRQVRRHAENSPEGRLGEILRRTARADWADHADFADCADRADRAASSKSGPPPHPCPLRLWPAEPVPEIPSEVLAEHLFGSRRLAACGCWPRGVGTVDDGEEAMLTLIGERAGIAADQEVLVVDAGWGSPAFCLGEDVAPARLVLWTLVPERAAWLEEHARKIGLRGLEIHSGSIDDGPSGSPTDRFDRIVAIETLAAFPEPQPALSRMARYLKPGGRLFVQLPCHRRYAYTLGLRGRPRGHDAHCLAVLPDAFVASTDLLPELAPELTLVKHWEASGEHYERTVRAWRARLHERADAVLADLSGDSATGETAEAESLCRRLDQALMARQEMFGFRGGQEWWISHYLFERR